jgi:hypothetical protein
MKRIVTGILFGSILIFPMVCLATYVIHLKDGRSFTTPEYREEGDQIKFERYGGLIGLPREQVVSIEEIADLPEKKVLKPPSELPISEERQETPSKATEAKEEKTADQEKEDPQEALMEEKRRILAERESASLAFKEAKKKKDKGAKNACLKKLLLLRKELAALRKQVLAKNNGVLPSWWAHIE